MNPFEVLNEVRNAYKTFVHTFQQFKNPTIRDWVGEKVDGARSCGRNRSSNSRGASGGATPGTT